MNMTELSEKITALIDNEIQSDKEKNELELKINHDSSLYGEYITQKSVKSLLQNRFGQTLAPSNLHDNISKQTLNLYNAERESAVKPELKSSKKLINFLITPQFAIPAVIVMIALFLSSPLFSEKSDGDLVIEQAGTNNMYVQAVNNFRSILDGNLKLQCSSSNPIEVKQYFTKEGVPYDAKVPTFKLWHLIGGVVSEDGGKKFAHQVYTGDHGKILYLYQVDIDYLSTNGKEPIRLSKDLMTYLDNGKCLKMLDSSYKTFLWENDHKVFALVTNENPKIIEDNFLSSF